MRSLVCILLCLMVFVVPWEIMGKIRMVGSFCRMLGYVALGCAALSVLTSLRIRRLSSVLWLMGAFVMWSGLSLFWSVARGQTVNRTVTYIALLLFAWMIWEFCDTLKKQLWLLRSYLLGCVVPMAMMYYAFLTGQAASGATYTRYTGARMDQNTLSILLTLGIPIAICLAADPMRRSKLFFLAYWAYPPAAAIGVFLTGSRTGAAAVTVGVGSLLVLSQRGRKYVRLVLVVATICAVFGIVYVVPSVLLERTSEVATKGTGAMSHRLEIWQRAYEAYWEKPILGTGAGTFQWVDKVHGGEGRSPHSLFFSIIVQFGVVGFVLWAALLIAVMRNIKLMGRTSLRSTWLAVFLVWGVGSLALGTDYAKYTWFVLILIAVQFDVVRKITSARMEFTGLLPAYQVQPPLYPGVPVETGY